MKILCVLLIVLICHSAHTVGMGCVEGESEFHMKDRIQHCVENKLIDECTIDWTTINAVNACSRLTVSPSTATSCTLTVVKTTTVRSTQSTVTVTSTERVSQCPSTSEATPSMTTQQQLQPTNSVSRSTLSIPRPSLTGTSLPKWPLTSDMGSTHQSIASLSRQPSSTYQTTTETLPAVTSRAVPSNTAAGQPETMITPTPTNEVVDENQDQRRSLMCSTTIATILAIVSGTLLLCLTLSLVGWLWTCCVLRRMRAAHKQNTLADQRTKREMKSRNTEHKFHNPLYEINTPTDVHTYHTDGQEYETVMPGSQGYETVMLDDKNPAGAREHKFTEKTAANGGPYYHVLEKPLPDHDPAGLSEPNGEKAVNS